MYYLQNKIHHVMIYEHGHGNEKVKLNQNINKTI